MNHNYQHIALEKDDNHIVWMTIDVKGESANVINPDLVNEIDDACDSLLTYKPKGLIIQSGKENGFIAGADVKKFQGLSKQKNGQEIALKFIKTGQNLCSKIENLPFPTVAMIKGFCMGGGLEIALACDYIITDDSPATKLSLPEIKLGIHPGFGGTVRAIRRMGVLQAMPFMLTGRNLLPRQAQKAGLIDRCVPLRQLKTTATHTILDKPPILKPSRQQRLLETSFMRKVIAMQMRKQVAKKARQEHYPAPYALINIWEMHGSKSNEMFVAEAESVATLITTDTAQNLVRVFFLQNQLKALGNPSLFTPKHVHIVGGGVMGGDIAAWCAMQGMKVTLQDLNKDALAKVVARANRGFKRRYKKDRQRIMQAQDNLLPDLHGNGIKKADVIIEAIFENLEAKQELLKKVEKKAKPNAILASNTSSILLAEISQSMQNPERLIGLHFFNPVFKMPLLEVVYTPEQTTTEVIDMALSFASHINKLPLPVKSSPGFLINRILMPYILEGVTLFQQGVPVSVIDKAAVDYGMPMGPLELADTVGLDICLHVGEILADTVGAHIPLNLVEDVKKGNLGKKSGKGFYIWKQGKKLPPKESHWQGDSYKVQTQLIEKLLQEAKKCLDEGIVENSDLLDAGVIFGTGFAPFRGGPIHTLNAAKANI